MSDKIKDALELRKKRKEEEEKSFREQKEQSDAKITAALESRSRRILSDTNVDDTYINTFLGDAKSYVSDAINDLKSIGYGNASSLYDGYSSKGSDLRKRLSIINAYLNVNKSKLDEGAYNDMISALSGYATDFDNISNQFGKSSSYFKQWETEEDYNKAMADAEEMERLLGIDTNALESEIEQYKKIWSSRQQSGLTSEEQTQFGGVLSDKLSNTPNNGSVSMSLADLENNIKSGRVVKLPDGSYIDMVTHNKVIVGNNTPKESSTPVSKEVTELAEVYNLTPDELADIINQKNQDLNKARRLQKWQELSSVYDNEDFRDYSGVNADFAEDKTYKYINDIDGFRASELENWAKTNTNSEGLTFGSSIPSYMDSNYEQLNSKEIGTYNYLYATQGAEVAREYLDSVAETINTRRANELREENDTFLEQLFFSAAAGLDQWSSGVERLFDTSKDYYAPSEYQIASGMIKEDLVENHGKGWGTVYDVINTTSNMLPTILTSTTLGFINPALGTATGLATMGASTYGNAYAEMVNLGYGKQQAHGYATLTTGSEVGLQYLIGGFGKLGGKLTGNAVSKLSAKLVSNIDKAFARIAIGSGTKIVGNMVSEFGEEYLQEILTPVFKNMALGTHEDFKLYTPEALYSGFLGALSAGMLEGGTTIYGEAKYTRNATKLGKSIIDKGLKDDVVNLGESLSADSVAYKIANRVNENTGAYALGNLLHEAGANGLSATNMADIQKSLVRKGVSEKDAQIISEGLNSVVIGKELTDAQISALEDNDVISQTFRDVILNQKSTVNQRTQQYLSILDNLEKAEANKSNTSATEATQTVESLSKEYEAQGMSPEQAKMMAVAQLSESNPNTSSPSAENLTESKFGVSDDGKTINLKTDKEVAIQKIDSISESGEANLTLDDGMIVKASDVAFSSPVERAFIEGIGAIKIGKKPIGVDSANALYQMAMTAWKSNPDMTASEADSLIRGLAESYAYGTYNLGSSKLSSRNEDGSAVLFAGELSQEQRSFAYNLGLGDSVAKAKAEQKVVDDLKAKANEGASSNTTAKKGRVRFEDGVVAKGRLQKRTVALAKHLARAIGIDIVFYDARTTSNEDGKGANGYFDEDTDTIYLDLQNSFNDAKTIAFTLSHELVHFIKKWSPAKFDTFSKFLMEQYAQHGVDSSQLLANKMKELGTEDADLAYEEMICDACETMLLDSDAVYKLMELRKTDLELFDKIKLHIHKLLNKIRDMYKSLGLEPSSDEAKALLEMKDVLEQIYALFEEASVDAVQSYQAVGTLETESVSVSENGTIKMQMKQYQQTGRATLLKYLKEQYGEADANDLISTIDNIYNAMAEIKKDTALSVFGNWQDTEVELDENGHPIFTTSINNGDYKLNQDFSRVCKKRRQLDFVLNMLAEDPAFEASNLTKDDIVKINQAIKKHGFEIACALCFVDSKRFRQTEWADSFANTWNDILYSVVDDTSKLTPFNFATQKPNLADDGIEIDTSKPVMYRKWSDGKEDVKNRKNYDSFDSMLEKKANGKFVEGNANVRTIVKILKENPHLRHTFRGADIIGSQGFDTIQRLAPNIRGILDGWGGTSVPKPSSNDAIYDNSVLNIAGYNSKSAFAIGGVRMNSFSDFMAHMFFDYVQAFADLSAKELPMHSYTKELDFARLFGLTKGKINMSAIAAIRENATDLSKIKKKADKDKATEWEKSIAGLDISKLANKLGNAEADITYDDIIQNLDECEYVWADESIDVRSATLLQSGIMYDNLTEGKAAYCYELIKEGKFEEAFKVAGGKNVNRGYAKHLGIITVGVSKAHILKLLRDPTIRMVIPYHKSGLNAQVAAALKIAFYEDFTDVQNTMLLKSDGSTVGLSKDGAKIGDKTIRDFNFYDYFGKTIEGVFYDGKATASKYIDWCKNGEYNESVGEYGYYLTDGSFVTKAELDAKGLSVLPKFNEFAEEENYYKLVEDFDCYDTITGEHSPQEAVDFFHDGLPTDYKSVLTKALEAEQKVSDDFRDHLDNHGLRDEVMQIVKSSGNTHSIKKQAKPTNRNENLTPKPIPIPGTTDTMSQTFVDDTLKSFGIDNLGDFEQVQERIFDTLLKEGFFTDTNPISRKDTNDETGMVIETNKHGIDETFCLENFGWSGRFKKVIKLATIRELPNAIKYGQLIDDNVRNNHGKNRGTKYAYLRYNTKVDGIDITLKITVRKSSQKNMFWVHGFEAIKNVSDTPADTNEGIKTGYKSADIGKIIHQEEKIVKKQLKKTSSSYAPTFYSQMGKVVEGVKQEKLAANSVVNLLRGKGVKAEEIRWSGIVPFLEGKKSVTKQELLDFINGSMLQIGEQMSGINQEAYDELEAMWMQHMGVSLSETFSDDFDLPLTADNMADVFDDAEKEGYDVPFIEDQLRMIELARQAGNEGRWSKYKLAGGRNYRELVFTLPNSTYTNRAMKVHWGQDAEGVLVHARIQDFDVNGKKMLFIEEIQSDWHNEGHSKGYSTKEYEDAVESQDKLYNEYKKLDLAFHKYVRSNEFMTDPDDVRTKKHSWLRRKAETAQRKYLDAEKVVNSLKEKGAGDTPDAPFKDNYHEYVLKRLLRMAAEQGYDSIGWTPADIQSERWSDQYAEGYRIEYDQDMPKFLKKYGRQWGATVGKTPLPNLNAKETYYDVNREESFDSFAVWQDIVRNTIDQQGGDQRNVLFGMDGNDWIAYDKHTGVEYDRAKVNKTSDSVWSMDITDSMKNSVLYEGQAMFQQKKETNRTILANSLESAAQNDIERNKLAQYKEKISLIEAEEQRLSEIQKQLFTKGGVEPAQRKELQFEAKQIANRINTYDRQLLNLESTTALKNVLNREKELARKRQKQIDAEILRGYKEKVAKTTRELMDRHKESRKKATESRNRTAMRHKIKTVVNDLNNLLLKPSKERHVPEELRIAVAEALEIVNMDTIGADERVAKYNDLIAKAKDPDVIASLTATRDRILEQGNKLSEKLGKLKDAYEMVRDSADDSMNSMYDEVIYNKITSVQKKVGKTPLRNMTLEQLENVYDLYTMVLTIVRDSNKAFAENLKMTRLALGSNAFAEIKENNKTRDHIKHESLEKFGWQNLKPMQAMKTIGSGILQKLWNNILYGQEVFAQDYDEAVKFAIKMKEKYGYDKWNLNKLYSFESKSGKAMKINLEQMMSIYAYSKRNQADEHIEYGGIVLNEGVIKEKNKLGKIVEVKVNDSTAYRLDKMQVGEIVATLEREFPGAKGFVDEMQKYLSETMGEKGNEVSMKMYGIRLFKEEHYFPLKSSKDFMEAANAKLKGDVKIKNKGMTKSTVEHARNPIVLENFLDVWGNHINEMALYHGLVLPLEDFSRTLNYSFKADEKLNTDAESVRTALHDAFGDNADNYLNELLKAINGGVLHDSTATFADKMIGKFKKAKVMASLSVIVQQPTAIIRAMGIIDPKYFVSQNFHHKATWEELKKYCPTAIIKETGSFDTNMGRTIVDMIKDERGFTDKVGDILGKAPAFMDEMGWNMIWRALKKKVATEQNLSGEALLRECGKQMTLIINETQVYDSVLARNELMRSKNALTKMATAFGAEPSTVANMVYGAVLDFKRGKKGIASKTVAAVITSVVVNGLVSAMVYALRDDDEDETLLEKYLSSATTEVLDGLNPLTYIPFIKDAYSLFQGYKVERTDMALIKDLVDAVDDFYNVLDPEAYEGMSRDEIAKHIYENSVPMLTSICDIFGLPVGNVLRDAKAIIVNDNVPMSQASSLGTKYAFKDGLLSSLPKIVGKVVGTDTKQDKLYEAIVKGDKSYIDRLKSGYKDDKAYESAVRKALRENDHRIREAAEARIDGDIAEYTRIVKEIKAEGFFSQDTIVASVNAEINAINKGEDTKSSSSSNKAESIYKMDDYYASIVGGDQASAYVVKDDIINTDVANGKDRDEAEDSFNGRFASHVREQFEEGNLSEYDAEKMLVNYGSKSEEDAASKVQYWAFKKEYPDYDDLSEEAVDKYYNEVEPHGITIDVYYDYSKKKSKCKGVDANGDGKTDSGSVKVEVLRVINSLPLSRSQKDALYYLNGWSAKTIYEAPWH